MFKVGDRIMLIDVPDCYKEDLYRVGTFMGYGSKDINGGQCVDIQLDGENGLTVAYDTQIISI